MIEVKRKYIYETLYTVQGFYGQWEDETTEETYKTAKEAVKVYRENMPAIVHRIKKSVTKTLKG